MNECLTTPQHSLKKQAVEWMKEWMFNDTPAQFKETGGGMNEWMFNDTPAQFKETGLTIPQHENRTGGGDIA